VILVTGGAGFIGSNIVAGLSQRGRGPIVVADSVRDDDRRANIAKHGVADVVAPDDVMTWLAGRGDVEAVIHMGAISSTTEMDVDLILKSNVWLSLELWDWCAANDVPLIYASSAQVYGDGDKGFVDDETPAALGRLKAITPYGASKLLFDQLVMREVGQDRAQPPQWAGLRFFNVYGPNEYHKGDQRSVIAKAYAGLAAGGAMRLFKSYRPDYPDGGQKRDFVYVADCVAVVLWLLDRGDVSGIFNLGTGQARTWLDLAHAMFAAMGRAPKIDFIEMPEVLRGRYQYVTQADMTKLRRAGYDVPFTSLEDGVGDYIKNFLATDDPFR
jgi:ADP-L-glycero-D-manno-heptose 6-epimerase